ncbi:MAG: HAD hydrolase-like protein [Phycisphaerae bacterium]|nr:HAD hydrolase-like protein [Phycisphaerae bacterium]
MTDTTREPLTLFFDLDGTLSDPSDGITRCIQYALERLGRPYPPKAELVQFIGPPLRWTFPRLLGSEDKDLIDAALYYYRQRYGDVGLFENQVYPGVPEMLARLQGEGHSLYVVTSKPTVYSNRIVERFGFDRYFLKVYGPQLDGRFDEKSELIEHILQELSLDPGHTVMIGDRARDVESGQAHNTRTIGVTYGFGSEAEIAAAAPDEICHSPAEIDEAVHRCGTLEERDHRG